MIEPKLAQKLMKNKDVVDLTTYLSQELLKLNQIDDITVEEPELVAIELKARKLAYKRLKDILTPLLNSRGEKEAFNREEYYA